MISMIFAVQFISLTSQLDLPDAHSSFRDLGEAKAASCIVFFYEPKTYH
jgi:hypothetical protein